MSTHISELRTELLATLRDLRCKERPMEPDRARAVAQVAAVMVDTARVEVDYVRANGGGESEFIEAVGQQQKLPQGITAITRHRLAG